MAYYAQPQQYQQYNQPQQDYYSPPPQQQQYPVQQTYSHNSQRDWQPNPPHSGGFHDHPEERSWNPQQIWSQYNNPPEPQFGRPNDGSQVDTRDARAFEPQQYGGVGAGQQFEGQPGEEGERGLGATLIGGAGGAFLGHKMEHGALGTLGGLAIGAIAANAFEHHHKKKKEEHREERAYDDGYVNGERRDGGSRDIDGDDGYYRDDRYSERGYDRYDDDEDYRPHHHHHHHHRDYDDDDYSDSYSRRDSEYYSYDRRD